ncbi:hypothetical protein LTR62_007223 [Meristemomyces frigidus]|uniref:Chromo domain-containing protein n=1 Tax=Meristemomyces frigidus TaxID=1508187 RepID=A0AAN7YDX2_9PEZI|nr:hypothetical protein LTR62_007223 [Meristemomyces frigidus]
MGGRGPFEESDIDSVASNTTQESGEGTYNVDRILAETEDEYGQPHYLLKWTGYPDHRSTWEPRQNLNDGKTLAEWVATKLRIQYGDEQPFDLEAWQDECQRLAYERKERHQRRKQKRRRRGVPVPASGEEYDEPGVSEDEANGARHPVLDSDDEIDSLSRRQRSGRVDSPPLKRKGIAPKVRDKRRRTSDSPTEEPAEEHGNGQTVNDSMSVSDLNSLFEERSQPSQQGLAPPSKLASNENKSFRPGTSASTNAAPKYFASAGQGLKSTKKQTPLIARKFNSSIATAKRSVVNNIFASFNNPKPLQRRKRRLFDDDQAPHLFKSLSHRTRYQYFNHNERQPDLNALAVINPETGRFEQPNAAQADQQQGTEVIDSVYARRAAKPNRQQSITPPGADSADAVAPDQALEPTPTGPSASFAPPLDWKRSRTCVHWMENNCRHTAQTCPFAHWYITVPDVMPQASPCTLTGIPETQPQFRASDTWTPKDQTSCLYWLKGNCKFTDAQCEFAHALTGVLPRAATKIPELLAVLKRRETQTCPAWRTNNCPLLEVHCMFPHHETGAIDEAQQNDNTPAIHGKDKTYRPWREGDQFKRTEDGYNNVDADLSTYNGLHRDLPDTHRPVPTSRMVPPQHPHVPKKQTTCHFWNNGGCNKSDEECAFAHYKTGILAGPPGSFKQTFEPLSLLTGSIDEFDSSGLDLSIKETVAPVLENTAMMGTMQSELSIYPTMIQIRSSGSSSYRFIVNVHVSAWWQFEKLFYPVSKGVSFMLDRMIVAKDVETWLAELVTRGADWPAGSIVPTEEYWQITNKVTECGKLYASGFASLQDSFTLLVYPADSDQWRFIEPPNMRYIAHAPLRFRLLPPLPRDTSPNTMAGENNMPSRTKERAAIAASKYLLGFDPQIIVAGPDKKQNESNHVFLAWPEYHNAELRFLVRLFLDLNCKVYHSGTPGAWDYLIKHHKSFAVAVHPETQYWRLPGFAASLNTGSNFRVFRIGPNMGVDPALSGPVYSCTRLFPNSKATLITDDIFTNYPELASRIIREFLKEANSKLQGGRNDKIVTRPGIKNWLKRFVDERTYHDGAVDKRWMKLYMEICELCPIEAEGPDSSPNPLPSSYLVSLPAEQMPSFAALSTTDPEAAADILAEWFVGWSVENAVNFRRFVICHESQVTEKLVDEHGRLSVGVVTDPRGWGDRWRHVSVVRPEQILKKSSGGK